MVARTVVEEGVLQGSQQARKTRTREREQAEEGNENRKDEGHSLKGPAATSLGLAAGLAVPDAGSGALEGVLRSLGVWVSNGGREGGRRRKRVCVREEKEERERER